jgi:hypothetical protein
MKSVAGMVDFPRGCRGWDAVWFVFRNVVKNDAYIDVDRSLSPVQDLENELTVHIEEDLFIFTQSGPGE